MADPAQPYRGLFAMLDGHPVGYLGGLIDQDVLFLDMLVDPAGTADACNVLESLIEETLEASSRADSSLATVRTVEMWAKPADDCHQRAAERFGFEPARALHQMRCTLPTKIDAIATRSFVPGQDDEALRQLNNAAFEGHPDQGALSVAAFQAKLAEPGVTPEGIRIHEVDGRMAGFCWTKIHEQPPLGEIFAIGLHPSQHGKGLGKPMTAAGLDWLCGQGMATGMLYVEADNDPAVRTYLGMGFEVVRTDRAWSRPLHHSSTPDDSTDRATP